LKGEFAKNSSSRCQKLVDIAQSNAERLLLLINDLLDIDKIESGLLSFDFKIIDVMSMIEEALRGAETYAGQYNILFRIGSRADGAKVQGDRDRLIQVMYNLLSNASKFSPPGSTVDINVTQRNETVMIEVADKGAGIPVEFQPMVFDRFTQSDSSDARHAGGTGLGLSITRSLVEKHGGEIGFRTDPNGTTFYVVLPAIA
jgi:signal transduction histidine kinase